MSGLEKLAPPHDDMRGRADAQRDADRYAWAFITLRHPPKRVERVSAEEDARIGEVAERVVSRRWVTPGWSADRKRGSALAKSRVTDARS